MGTLLCPSPSLHSIRFEALHPLWNTVKLSICAVPFLMCCGLTLPTGSCMVNMCKILFSAISTKSKSSQSKKILPLDFKQKTLHFKLLHFIDGYFSTAMELELDDL